VGPVFVTVVLPRTAKESALPSGTAVAALAVPGSASIASNDAPKPIAEKRCSAL